MIKSGIIISTFTTGVTKSSVTTELYDPARNYAKPMLLVTESGVTASSIIDLCCNSHWMPINNIYSDCDFLQKGRKR